MKNPKFQLYRNAADNQYYFQLRASNGQVILVSKGHDTKHSCMQGIVSAQKHAADDRHYERLQTLGRYSFSLNATNGRNIGKSDNYTSFGARDNGIDSVKRNAAIAGIEDVTQKQS